MHVRKLVKSGYTSLVIAIPKEWIDRNKLMPGDLVYINEEANDLRIKIDYKEKKSASKEKVISIDGKGDHTIMREIAAAYLNNYDFIIIKGAELKKNIKQVKKCISDLVALELVDESSDRIVAKSFLNLHDTDIKVLVKRIDNIIRSMILDSKEVYSDASLVNAIHDRDEEVNRLTFMVSKILKSAYNDKSILSALHFEEMDILRYWELNGSLEKIGDRIKNIAEIAISLKQAQRKCFLELFSHIESLFKEAMKSFYEKSSELSDEVSVKRKKLLAEIKNYINESNSALCSQIAVNAYNMTAHINDISRIARYLD